MGAIVLKHNWARQPNFPARINWKHPLTENLRAFCVPCGNTFIDLVSRKLFVRQLHAVEYPYVEGQRFLGADTVGAGFYLDGVQLTDTVKQSVACFARVYNTVRNDIRKRALRFANAAANSTVVNIDYSGGTNNWSIFGGVQIAGPIWPTVTLENDHNPGVRNVGFSRRANGGADFIGLPVNLGSTFWTAADFAYTIDSIFISGSAVDTFPLVGGIAFAGFYSEYTTFAKLDAITKNPWQILLPNRRLLWNGIGVSVNELNADEVTTAPAVVAPVLGQIHPVVAEGISDTAVCAQPVFAQNHQLQATLLESISVLQNPAINQEHALLVNAVVSSPVLGTPNISVDAGIDNLATPDIASSAIFLASPGLGQIHGLAAAGISDSIQLEHPVIAQNHVLSESALIVNGNLASPVLRTIHSLIAASIDVNAFLGHPGGAVLENLASPDTVVSGSLTANPGLAQIHNLVPFNLNVVPVNESPVILQQHSLTALGLVSIAFLDSPKVLAWEFLPKTHVEIDSYGDTQFEYAAVGSFEIRKTADGILQITKSAEGITSGVLQLRLTSIGKFS